MGNLSKLRWYSEKQKKPLSFLFNTITHPLQVVLCGDKPDAKATLPFVNTKKNVRRSQYKYL